MAQTRDRNCTHILSLFADKSSDEVRLILVSLERYKKFGFELQLPVRVAVAFFRQFTVDAVLCLVRRPNNQTLLN